MIEFKVNGETVRFDGPVDTPLLWVLREDLAKTGTKYGCGAGLCGACTVHIDGQAVRSCTMPVAGLAGREITTIEGIGQSDLGRKIQEAWVAEDVPQCGYCQSGQIMSAAALLKTTPNPSDTEISAAMTGNICRCGAYNRIRSAIHRCAGAPTVEGA